MPQVFFVISKIKWHIGVYEQRINPRVMIYNV